MMVKIKTSKSHAHVHLVNFQKQKILAMQAACPRISVHVLV